MVCERCSLVRKMKTISGPRIRNKKQRLRRILFDLFSQPIDENTEVFQLVPIIRPPYGLKQFAMSNGLIRSSKEICEQTELPCGDARSPPKQTDFPGRQVDIDPLIRKRLEIRRAGQLR